MWKNGHPKPIIGLAGGVGSGKSFVAQALADLGCGVVSADTDAHAILNLPEVQAEICKWWGDDIVDPDGRVNRKKVAAIVFGDARETARLNGLVHPRVSAIRLAKTSKFMQDKDIRAVVWDVPLLYEVDLAKECDAVIFVDARLEDRLERVSRTRGWGRNDLISREKLQMGLDKKRKMADYVVNNSGEGSASLRQVQQVLSQILSRTPPQK